MISTLVSNRLVTSVGAGANDHNSDGRTSYCDVTWESALSVGPVTALVNLWKL